MDIFLGKVTQQAMNYAIRSGITMTAGYAIKQTSRLLKTAVGDERDELQDLQLRLESKIKIISPAIDMIELISARGNTSLESAVTLTKSLRYEIQSLGQRLAKAAEVEEDMQRRVSRTQDKARHDFELKQIAKSISKLLSRIEDAVPLISLAITASGATLSSSLPSTISPSRLLQASTFLTAGDSQYGSMNSSSVQIGPIFTLSMYMLFRGHLRPQNEEDVRATTWKEVMHKADVRLMRVPITALYAFPGHDPSQTQSGEVRPEEYAYHIVIVEDLDDDRVHTFEDDGPHPERFGDISLAGIREILPIHEISKIFYADTGKILNLGTDGETNNPILLLKRDMNASPPRRMTDGLDTDDGSEADYPQFHQSSPNDSTPLAYQQSDSASQQLMRKPDPWRLPQDLDPEWIAFEVYSEAEGSDTEADADIDSPLRPRASRSASAEPSVAAALSRLNLNGSAKPSNSEPGTPSARAPNPQPALPPIKTSLSLLEMLLRLLSLQQFQQAPHLSIPDELLTFFLSEAASTGAASNDGQERRRLREDAKHRVGFDPYDESPIKRHGEDYQYSKRAQSGEYDDGRSYSDNGYSSPLKYEDEGYGTVDWARRRASRSSTPQTPSVVNGRSRSGTPQSQMVESDGRPPPISRWGGRLRNGGEKKGSPLRPSTGLTDEGLGTSPGSTNDDECKG